MRKTSIGNLFRDSVPFALVAGVVTAILLSTSCGGGGSPPPPVLSITSMALSDGTIGASYSQTVEERGGVAPFTWGVSAGSLPHGLNLGSATNDTVTISGTPDTVQTNVSFTIQVRDTPGQAATQTFSVDIRNTVVQTQSGALQGVVDGSEVAFRGIPYAAPPIGDLRWQAPQGPLAWAGTRDASGYGDMCPQTDDSTNLAVGSEDCLFLNIFVSSQVPHGQKQPVMVFIHGGSNRQGGGGAVGGRPFDVPPLAKQSVLVVTIQYRLGMLGFFVNPLLTSEGGGSSGNYGLMDQIEALRWIQRNIAGFGGDPTHVMVFGHSAGSVDIQLLLTSPLAQGLVSAAVMMSSSAIHGAVLPLATMEALEEPLVGLLGCDKAADVLACLRAVPAADVVNHQSTIPTIPGGLAFRTLVVEPRVVPMDPYDAFQQNGIAVPLLIGSTREEASGLTPVDDPTANPPLDEAGYEAALHAEFDPLGAGVTSRAAGDLLQARDGFCIR